MPDPFDRHSRSKSEWGAPGARSQERAEAARDDPARSRTPGKKDPSLCKAAHWKGPHKPELRMQEYGWRRETACKWAISWREPGEPSWHCNHEEACSGCGKILRTKISDEECPGYHPITDGEVAALEAKRAEDEARTAATRARSRWQQRPPITGPQGYRRRRSA